MNLSLLEKASMKGQDTKTPPSPPPMDPVRFHPYPDYNSSKYLQDHYPVEQCFLDNDDRIPAPEIFAYPGVPQNMSAPFFGSYQELGLSDDVCFERYGRLGPYGYGYDRKKGGLGLGQKSEKEGSDKVFSQMAHIDYTSMDWGTSQKRCYEKNKARFEGKGPDSQKKKVARQAYVLRTWQGYDYDEHQMASLRAMISELSLKSGGEYDVHFLMHVKDNGLALWTDKSIYQKVIEDNMPEEFWNMTTLWSDNLMRLYYPEPFPDNVENPSEHPVHSVYRSAHFSVQWFAQQHSEYDFYWNWEMDLRYTGHYYEFHNQIGEWAKKQPRKGAWERSSRYYIPQHHGSWSDFVEMVEEETFAEKHKPVWGPPEFKNNGLVPAPNDTKPPTSYIKDKYEWGVGEEADLITFNPIFDPDPTDWVFRQDVNGYDKDFPVPPRRTAIITVSRFSKRLLDIMHQETYIFRHTMFPEMWPPSCALQHGLKAVYAPHPVYFDRNWPLEHMDKTFNHMADKIYGEAEHSFAGSSFYYNSGFAGALWRRWLGYSELKEGGKKAEQYGSGRMCLRSTLLHPIKKEAGPID